MLRIVGNVEYLYKNSWDDEIAIVRFVGAGEESSRIHIKNERGWKQGQKVEMLLTELEAPCQTK